MPRVLASLTLLLAAAAFAQPTADTIYAGGPIITINDAAMRAEALAIKDGKIIAVGPKAEVDKFAGPQTTRIDLAGKALLPGFIDAHGHVMMGGMQALSANMLAPPDGNVTDIASLKSTLREWIAANQTAVDKLGLIVGFGYDPATLKEQRDPTRHDLDEISKDIPILLVHQSSHLFALNSKALEICGITADSPEVPGGVIRREADGKTPTGVLEETAGFTAIPKLISRLGAEGFKQFSVAGSELWARFGYTTAQDGRAVPATLKLLREAASENDFKIDINVYVDVLVDRDLIKKEYSTQFKNHVRVAGAKLTIDGSPQGFTAWRDRPYYAPVGDYKPGYSGYAAASAEQVADAINWCFENDMQVITHANGEAAIDQLIAFISDATGKHVAKDRRNVLIHGQFTREDQIDALQRLDIIPSLFPMHTFYWGDWHRDHTVGPQLADNISPTGWCVQRGMKFTSHHDAPVAFPDSMRVLDATVTRRTRSGDILGPWQRVDVITGLKAMTIWPAYQHFEETTKGSLEVGKLADLVILSHDPTAIDPEKIDEIKVVETIKQGKTIFVLDAKEQKRADLMIKPAADGDNAFENFLIAGAVQGDFAKLPPQTQRLTFMQKNLRAAQANAPHDKACVLRYMDELFTLAPTP
ncbi:MAG TPA: amidohydrolase [Phycisphaerales bacterium]|nr:amidohydrolase [Phycisphaerales bacterium]